jgi:hypothetical protein
MDNDEHRADIGLSAGWVDRAAAVKSEGLPYRLACAPTVPL